MTMPETLNILNDASSQKIVVMRIKRIIEKYSEVWRVLHEPIQNSIDAIQQRDDVKQGVVRVRINLKSGQVVIDDDGKGFPKDLDLLLPDGTDKDDQSDTMGYQGVGLKSVIYSSDKFILLSNLGNGESWGVEIANASQYLETEGEKKAPIKQLSKERDTQGTTLEVKFADGTVVTAIEQIIDTITSAESNFRWKWTDDFRKNNLVLRDVKNEAAVFEYMLKYYLRTHTYVGSVSRLLNCRLKPFQELYAKPVRISLEIDFEGLSVDDTGHEFFKKVIRDVQKSNTSKLNVDVDNKFIDFQEVIDEVQQVDPRSISFEIYDFDIKQAGIERNPTLIDQVYCKIMTPDYSKDEDDIEQRYAQYISLLAAPSEEVKEKNIRIFKDLFPEILGIYILIGRMEYFEKYLGNNYGIKIISANGIPTQHELTPRSSNQSFYFNPITFVLNINGKLNEGKTHLIDPSLERKCVKFFREAFESTLNRLAKEFVRTVPNTDPPPETDLVSKRVIDIENVDIKREPEDEDTLIALFYQLLKVRSITLPTYGLLRQGVFDGKFTYEDRNIRSDNDLKMIEFKVKLSALVNDFYSPNNPKNFGACDLIVVWNDRITTTQQQDWRVVNRDALSTTALRQSGAPDWIKTFLKDNSNVYKPLVIVEDWVRALDQNFR